MWGKERQIVGVVSHFHYESLYNSVGPLFIALEDNRATTFVRLRAGEEQATIARVGEGK